MRYFTERFKYLFKKNNLHCILIALTFSLSSDFSIANEKDQAYRIHIKLTGIPPSSDVLEQMLTKISAGHIKEAAYIAMENPNFYTVTLKNWATPWTNEQANIYATLNDYSATVIGMVRDDVDFREVLSADILYIGHANLGLPDYAIDNNAHYQALEAQDINLKEQLVATEQSAKTGLPVEATAGIFTTRAAAKSFFIDGTNRAMFRFTLINHLCTDLEALKDTSRAPDRIRQDVSRSPGGDSRLFMNSCSGCHSAMDPLTQAFAYYDFEYNSDTDPSGENGRLVYNQENQLDSQTNSRVKAKYHINSNNFKYGYITENDRWDNYWRNGINANLGWSSELSGSGLGAKSMGQELANSTAFAQCQVKKVFKNVCLRSPENSQDHNQIDTMVSNFKSSQYQIKHVFADAADYCKGN
ncbi:hypothetical protein [Pseudoalteromonas denitrificans]|uniref:DUF1585 domain-containing protein n=1 Tax=Pseudoalteromonas denitrificans DSM 6059 TaxID=1123010 RepID=A0A1I1SXE3_9GAMM|nr:hypothetical protein [Pseudoalteromonas denitrificans]SFD47700.1 hypothetical protein SAMN02745724_04627 [Pseudoalteromonas denitrificans DSM 6059]